jgi:hypothetical protein
MPRVDIDLPDEDLEEVGKAATENKRSRKAQLEWIIEDFVMRRLGGK